MTIAACYLGSDATRDDPNDTAKLITLAPLRYATARYYYGYYFGCEGLGLQRCFLFKILTDLTACIASTYLYKNVFVQGDWGIYSVPSCDIGLINDKYFLLLIHIRLTSPRT